jgi:DNA-binding MarR family transcriptional regulator
MEPLQNSLGFMLNVAARQMRRSLVQRLNDYGLTATQYITLWSLYECGEEIPLSQLGRKLFLDNPTVTGIVDRMERDGFLERVPDENDRRVIKVRLTKKSIDLREQVKEIATEIDLETSKMFQKPAYNQILEFLRRLTQNENENK